MGDACVIKKIPSTLFFKVVVPFYTPTSDTRESSHRSHILTRLFVFYSVGLGLNLHLMINVMSHLHHNIPSPCRLFCFPGWKDKIKMQGDAPGCHWVSGVWESVSCTVSSGLLTLCVCACCRCTVSNWGKSSGKAYGPWLCPAVTNHSSQPSPLTAHEAGSILCVESLPSSITESAGYIYPKGWDLSRNFFVSQAGQLDK